MKKIILAGIVCYAAGTAIGSAGAWAAWTLASHEHRYRINRRHPS